MTDRAALYCRISTGDQGLAGQELELRTEAARRGSSVVAIYAERVSATGRVERKVYERLLLDALAPGRGWSHLLVWSLDRWSRDERFTEAVSKIEALEAHGILFHSLMDPVLDSSEDRTPNTDRDLLRAILPVVAKIESRRKPERVRVEMREIREGRRPTRSARPPGRPRRVTPEKAARILQLRLQGLKRRNGASRVGLPVGSCEAV